MKFGISNYSFWKALSTGRLSLEDAFKWLHEMGCDHIEIADFVVDLHQPGMAEKVTELSAKYNLAVSNYSAGSMLGQVEGEEYEAELNRLKGEIDLAHAIGAPAIRCDLVRMFGSDDPTSIEEFDRLFPKMVKGAQDLADYAAQYGMDVLLENHGTFANGGDRVRRLVLAVNRPNYGCTIDVGNALCVDEDPMICVETLLPFVKRVHIKDFYIREDAYAIGMKYGEEEQPKDITGNRWFTTKHHRYLRGAIVGHGDIDLRKVIGKIVASGYNGDMTIEFEGMEDEILACEIGMRNLKQMVAMAQK